MGCPLIIRSFQDVRGAVYRLLECIPEMQRRGHACGRFNAVGHVWAANRRGRGAYAPVGEVGRFTDARGRESCRERALRYQNFESLGAPCWLIRSSGLPSTTGYHWSFSMSRS